MKMIWLYGQENYSIRFVFELHNEAICLLWWVFHLEFKESDILPKRLPKTIYVHVETENSNKHLLNGKFNFDSIRNNAPVFIRDGGKVPTFDPHPYYLACYEDGWYMQDADFFGDNKPGGWLSLSTKGLANILKITFDFIFKKRIVFH